MTRPALLDYELIDHLALVGPKSVGELILCIIKWTNEPYTSLYNIANDISYHPYLNFDIDELWVLVSHKALLDGIIETMQQLAK